MKNSKLVQVLKTFSNEDFKEFRKLTASPYSSRGRDLTPLLIAQKEYYPGFTARNFNVEKILKQHGKNGKPADQSLLKKNIRNYSDN